MRFEGIMHEHDNRKWFVVKTNSKAEKKVFERTLHKYDKRIYAFSLIVKLTARSFMHSNHRNSTVSLLFLIPIEELKS